MAHIIGRRVAGPRGDDDLAADERDSYSNLVLLCPTHHREIDKNEADWSPDKLRLAKNEHEQWVSSMLARSEIAIADIDNSDFLNARMKFWNDFCDGGLGIVVSLTPLRIEPDLVNVLDKSSQRTLESARVAGHGYQGTLNRSRTRPSEHGICNERRGETGGLDSYSFHLFGSGHCEVVYALNSESARLAEQCERRAANYHGATKLVRYTELAERAIASTQWCRQVWHALLPFRYMDFRVHVLSSRDLTIFSYEDDWRVGVFGYPLTSNTLTFKEIYEKQEFDEQIEGNVLRWIARSFGLQLLNVYNEKGQLVRPFPFR